MASKFNCISSKKIANEAGRCYISHYMSSIVQSLEAIFKMMNIDDETQKEVLQRLDSLCEEKTRLSDWRMQNESGIISSDLPSDLFPDARIFLPIISKNVTDDEFMIDSSLMDIFPS